MGTPPEFPADIPGLGPIRIRALQKAGFDTIAALRAACLDDLLAVRGMSEIKARHILDYLAQHPETAENKEADRRKAHGSALPGRTGGSSRFPTRTVDAIVYTQGRIIDMLFNAPPEGFRPRLTREMGQFAHLVEALNAKKVAGNTKDLKPALQRLQEVCDLLLAYGAQKEIRRKEQADLAEILSAVNESLRSLVREPSPVEAVEESHA